MMARECRLGPDAVTVLNPFFFSVTITGTLRRRQRCPSPAELASPPFSLPSATRALSQVRALRPSRQTIFSRHPFAGFLGFLSILGWLRSKFRSRRADAEKVRQLVQVALRQLQQQARIVSL